MVERFVAGLEKSRSHVHPILWSRDAPHIVLSKLSRRILTNGYTIVPSPTLDMSFVHSLITRHNSKIAKIDGQFSIFDLIGHSYFI